jgi:hypothetical protein
MEKRNGKIRTNGEHSTPIAEEGYCDETAQSGPSVHTDQATKSKKYRGKINNILDKGRIKEAQNKLQK